MREVKTACVIGAGYVGLPTAALLARSGIDVQLVDINERIVDEINDGTHEVEEESINSLIRDPEIANRITAALTPAHADVYFVCVPTPLDHASKTADLTHVSHACESISPHIAAGDLVIIESTIPVLCTRKTVKPLLESNGLSAGVDFHLAHCPERVLPGNAIAEIVGNSRVIGGITNACTQFAAAVYSKFVDGDLHLATDVEAEICKLSENAYRDVNIAFANELAAICEGLDVDAMRVIAIANRHPRVNILNPGIGVGGHCIAVDPWFIAETDRENSTLIQCARAVNDARPAKIAAKIREAVAHIESPTIVCSGIAFKPNCRDTRQSPAIEVIESLRADGYRVLVVDPVVDGCSYVPLRAIAAGSHALAVLVEHDATSKEIAGNDTAIRAAMRNPLILRFCVPVSISSTADRAAVELSDFSGLKTAA